MRLDNERRGQFARLGVLQLEERPALRALHERARLGVVRNEQFVFTLWAACHSGHERQSPFEPLARSHVAAGQKRSAEWVLKQSTIVGGEKTSACRSTIRFPVVNSFGRSFNRHNR